MTRFLLYPSLRSADGSGHLHRMCRLHAELPDSSIYIPREFRDHAQAMRADLGQCRVGESLSEAEVFVLDMPWVESSLLDELLEKGTVIAVDLGGAERSRVSYLIDTLPYPGERLHQRYFGSMAGRQPDPLEALSMSTRRSGSYPVSDLPNLRDPGLLARPPASKTPDDRLQLVLVSFGGQDPARLTEAFIRGLAERVIPGVQGRIIVPSGRELETNLPELPTGWEFTRTDSRLGGNLSSYDLCICAYGLLGWEAQFAGVKTLIIDASFYHQELARLSGFLSMPKDLLQKGRLASLLADMSPRLLEQAEKVQSIREQSLSSLLSQMIFSGRPNCPVCGNSRQNHALARSSGRSYFHCSRCSTIYLNRFVPDTIRYGNSYFFEDYRRQYGKTYLEDFQHIEAMGLSRVERIRRQLHTGTGSPSILDIGCAYGPFLSAASRKGWRCFGIDINEDAVSHVRSLGFDAWSGDLREPGFRDLAASQGPFDAVSLWYVIEHFADLTEILSWIHRILKPWGVLALSTPNVAGITGRSRLNDFLMNGPEDHFSIWSQHQAEQAGAVHGFMLADWVSTGHHPERFPGLLGTSLFSLASGLVSRIFSLGDSMELYFIRMPAETQEEQ